MDLPKNAFKAALKAGERQLGVWNAIPNPLVTELLAGCGYDWVLIDTEHTLAMLPDVVAGLQALAPYPGQPGMIPLRSNAFWMVGRNRY